MTLHVNHLLDKRYTCGVKPYFLRKYKTNAAVMTDTLRLNIWTVSCKKGPEYLSENPNQSVRPLGMDRVDRAFVIYQYFLLYARSLQMESEGHNQALQKSGRSLLGQAFNF